jgi:hypothetical protein
MYQLSKSSIFGILIFKEIIAGLVILLSILLETGAFVDDELGV